MLIQQYLFCVKEHVVVSTFIMMGDIERGEQKGRKKEKKVNKKEKEAKKRNSSLSEGFTSLFLKLF